MVRFVKGRPSTSSSRRTIVESGLEHPRAPTPCSSRAPNAFGLAQLYQLRGRIGRSKERAYCYPPGPEPEYITDEARRRLEALQPLHRARRRLPDRRAGISRSAAAGELLGAKQSGSIAAVGFDHYVKMLDAAVAELGGKPIHSEIDPELQIETPGFIPDDYVPDPGQRLELYKRLSAVEDDDELRDVMAEIFGDRYRYGAVPGEVILLGELMGVKAIARKLGALRARDQRSAPSPIAVLDAKVRDPPRSPPAGASCPTAASPSRPPSWRRRCARRAAGRRRSRIAYHTGRVGTAIPRRMRWLILPRRGSRHVATSQTKWGSRWMR